MRNIHRRSLSRVATAAGLLAASAFIASENMAATPLDPLAHLAGRWVGNAVMTPSSGPQSNFKCVVTYLPRKDAPGVQQNLRCDDGADFKLHAATDLQVEGGKVTGRWQDKINEIEGTVAGDVTPTGFEVQLAGRFFQAKMAVAGQGCDQSVKVMPQKSDVFRELAATLKKC
ncbi:MAG: hypothetical protein ABL893_18660 [Hyphomicrobium sp.]